MAFKVQEFISKLGQKNGISRRTHFEIDFTLPSFLKKYDKDHLTVMAVSANIPALNLDTTQIRRSTVSYNESFPTNVSFGDLSVTFFSDGQGQSLTIFKEWMNYIFPINFRQNNTAFRVPYKSEYTSVSNITHYDTQGIPIVKYTFEEVYPISIQDISMNWGALDDIVTVSAAFKYTSYSAKNVYVSPSPTSNTDPVVPNLAQNNRLPQTPPIKK